MDDPSSVRLWMTETSSAEAAGDRKHDWTGVVDMYLFLCIGVLCMGGKIDPIEGTCLYK